MTTKQDVNVKKPYQLFVLSVLLLLATLTNSWAQCNCKFTIPPGGYTNFDGAAKGVKPGDVICVSAGSIQTLSFTNIKGAAGNPVIIKNCGGQVSIGGANNLGMMFSKSQYVHIAGNGDAATTYGFKIIGTNSGSQGLSYAGLSSDVEIDHVEIMNTGYAGIMAKTDPSSNCADVSATRPNFTLSNVLIHDNYIHDTHAEGIYLGNSFYQGTTIFCGTMQYPHEVKNAKIYNNRFERTGQESIQVGGGVSGIEIYNNSVLNYGQTNQSGQNGGIQLGSGTAARCYNNFIKGGMGPAIAVQGIGGEYIYNNTIVNPGAEGITLSIHPTPLATDIVNKGYAGGVYIINNTFINPAKGAVVEWVNPTLGNVLYNNLAVGTAAATWDVTYKFTDWKRGNNLAVPVIANAKFQNAGADDYHLVSGSPAIDIGTNVTTWGVTKDADGKARPSGKANDAGAFEYGGPSAIAPVSNAGVDKTFTLPTNSGTLTGTGTDADGTIAGYVWTKTSGPAATLTNASTATLSLSSLVAGTYVFRLTVTDNSGLTGYDEATVTVKASNPPVVNAGTDKTITLPTSSTTLTGTATDSDGTIAVYAWTKTSGGAATLAGANTATLSLSALVAGTYIFRLTATDNSGLATYDEVTLTVKAASAPVVNAGADKTITLPATTTTLTGTATDADGTIASYAWTKTSGGAATLAGANTATLSLSALVAGTYVFRLTATDNSGLTGYDDVTLIVKAASAPVINAGADKTITLPATTTTLTGTATDADGTIASYAWTKISGVAATLAGANTATLSLSALVAGTYVFRLTATDNSGLTGYDDVTLTVKAASAPVVNAGTDKSITLPTNTVSIAGTATDADGTIASYAWTKTSGGAATLAGANTATLSVSAVVAGTYVFRLTATDNSGLTGYDDVTVTVATAVASTGTLVYRVNAGGTYTIPATKMSWIRDSPTYPSQYLDKSTTTATRGGNVFRSSNTTGASDSVFAPNRYSVGGAVGDATMQWNFPLANGKYEVRLYFSETTYAGGEKYVNARLFDVKMEGTRLLSSFDIYATAGMNAVMKTFIVSVTDGNLDIDFIKVKNDPQVNGFEILTASLGTPVTPSARVATVASDVPKEEADSTLADSHAETFVIDVYPNPFRDQFTVTFGTEQKAATITLIDMSGRPLYQEALTDVSSGTIDVSRIAMPAGVYVLIIKAENGKTIRRKVIKDY